MGRVIADRRFKPLCDQLILLLISYSRKGFRIRNKDSGIFQNL